MNKRLGGSTAWMIDFAGCRVLLGKFGTAFKWFLANDYSYCVFAITGLYCFCNELLPEILGNLSYCCCRPVVVWLLLSISGGLLFVVFWSLSSSCCFVCLWFLVFMVLSLWFLLMVCVVVRCAFSYHPYIPFRQAPIFNFLPLVFGPCHGFIYFPQLFYYLKSYFIFYNLNLYFNNNYIFLYNNYNYYIKIYLIYKV